MKSIKKLLLRSVLAVMMVATVVSFSYVSSKEAFANTPMFSGYLVDQFTNEPIPNASVIIGGIETYTDSNGYYKLNVPMQGTFNVLGYVDGYEPFLTVSEVTSNNNVELNMELMPAVSSFARNARSLRIVTGIVRDVNLPPSNRNSLLVGATVSDVTSGSGIVNPASDVTDSLGSYRLIIQHDEPLNIKAEMLGFNDYYSADIELTQILTIHDINMDNRELGTIEVIIPDGDENTLVFLNEDAGIALGQSNSILFEDVTLGEHTVYVYTEGYEFEKRTITIDEVNYSVQVNVDMVPVETQDATDSIISGIVTDNQGLRIPNFRLIIGGEVVPHDNSGYYTYNAEVGTYSILLSSDGYISQGEQLVQFENKVLNKNFVLQLNEDPALGTYTISGIAKNYITGAVLSGLDVINTLNSQTNTRTDDNGFYVMSGLGFSEDYSVGASLGNINFESSGSINLPEDVVIDLLLTSIIGYVELNVKDNQGNNIISETQIYIDGELVETTDTGIAQVEVSHGTRTIFVFNKDYVAQSYDVIVSDQNHEVTADFVLNRSLTQNNMSIAQIIVSKDGKTVPFANVIIGDNYHLQTDRNGYLRYYLDPSLDGQEIAVFAYTDEGAGQSLVSNIAMNNNYVVEVNLN